MVQRKVVGDREQPRRELGSRPIALARLVNPQEDILAKVLGFLEAADEMIEDADKSILIPLDQGLERAWDVVAHLEHEPDVRVSGLQLPFQNIELAMAHEEILQVMDAPRGSDRGHSAYSSQDPAIKETSIVTEEPGSGARW